MCNLSEGFYEAGLEKGMMLGIEKGIESGKEEGKKELLRETVIKMHKKGFSVNTIADITEVTTEQINEWITNSNN